MGGTPQGAAIAVWEDDPVGAVMEQPPPANSPQQLSEPDLDPPNLPVGIKLEGGRTAPAPGVYAVGTDDFRYWALAEALARSATFWSGVLPQGTTWQPDNGPRLIAELDGGLDFNAYYDRAGLHFFHGEVRGTKVYSGESPDVVCHELGHAVLDAVKPQLWDAASIECAAFHESFADCSAILSNLQLASMRDKVISETDGQISRASSLSRLAENLGWAIRQLVPDAAAPDCLRNAVNSLYYQAPASLPPRAPAVVLSSEPHSFSRVFTAGFLRMLDGIFQSQPARTSDGLLKASQDAGRLLIEGVRRSPVVPGFYAQVAAHMVEADADLFRGRYGQAIRSAFAAVGVLSIRSAAELGASRLAAVPAQAADKAQEDLPRVPLSGSAFGLPADLYVWAAAHSPRFGVAGGMPDVGDTEPPAPDRAATSFVEDLMRRGRIATGTDDIRDAPLAPSTHTTHTISHGKGGLELRRTRFDCGFGGN